MRISREQRKRLTFYLREFYKHYKEEKYTIFHFVRYFKLRLKQNKDAWMGVSGETGTGKSYFVLMCMMLFGRPMSLIQNVTYIPKGNEIVQKFEKLNFQALLIDEAAKEMRAVNWQSKQQQKVNLLAMTERFKNNWIFLNMPNFAEFTKSMRTGNIHFRAIIPYRTSNYARVIIQRKSRNWRSEDPWGDNTANEIYKKLDRQKREIGNDTILKIERSLPNTLMDFIIPNLALPCPEVIDTYERLKRESRIIDREEEEKKGVKKDPYKIKYEEILTRVSKILVNNELDLGKVKVTKSEISKALGIGGKTLNKYLAKENPKSSNFRENIKAS